MSSPEIQYFISNNYINKDFHRNPKLGTPFRKGQIGCALSHIRLWEHIVFSNISQAVILEDDASLHDHFIGLTQQMFLELRTTKWDHFNLYHHPNFANKLRDPSYIIPGKRMVLKGLPMWGTVAYAVSLSGARRLIRLTKPIFNTIDEMIRALITTDKITSFTSRYPLITTEGSTTSNLGQNTQLNSTIWRSGRFTSSELIH
jgi:glycosyl transferase family 25